MSRWNREVSNSFSWAASSNMCTPPIVWLRSARTSHSAHGVGWSSWSGVTAATMRPVWSTARMNVSIWSMPFSSRAGDGIVHGPIPVQGGDMDVAGNTYLEGYFAPVTEEVTAEDLPVTG